VAIKTSIARRYARALLLIAKQQNKIQEFKAELGRVAEFFERQPELFSQILSPGIGRNAREKILLQILPAFGLSQELSNFILILNQKSRLDHLLKIYESYVVLSDDALGIQRAKVYSAHPLQEDIREKLIKALEKRTGKTVKAEFQLDPSLIGGLKVQIGSLLLDGSIRAQLDLMKERLTKI